MDHDEALEVLHQAAVEPGGLDRLMAGDTTRAAAFAGHLAGCPTCADELERLRRAVPLLRDVVRSMPPADLRERTLAFVRERGTVREAAAVAVVGTAGAAGAAPGVPAASHATPREAPESTQAAGSTRTDRREVLGWIAAIAAAVLISVVATSWLVGRQVDARLAEQQHAIERLQAVTSATIDIGGEPDAARVRLASTDGSESAGELLFSPRTTELVVYATGLSKPDPDMEYRCWMDVDGVRQPVGKMFFADDLAYWIGETAAVATVTDGVTFGVSLTEVGGSSLQADPVIAGEL